MNTIIEKIRAEIERRREEAIKNTKNHDFDEAFYSGKSIALGSLLSFLSDLEKSNSKDFPTTDEEMKEFLATHPKVEVPERYKKTDWVFEQPVCEGLEEEYKDYVESDPVYSKLVNRNAGLSIARHFAQWGAEHLKK